MKSLKNTFNKTDSSHLITVGNTFSLTPSFSIATTTQADLEIFLNLLYVVSHHVRQELDSTLLKVQVCCTAAPATATATAEICPYQC